MGSVVRGLGVALLLSSVSSLCRPRLSSRLRRSRNPLLVSSPRLLCHVFSSLYICTPLPLLRATVRDSDARHVCHCVRLSHIDDPICFNPQLIGLTVAFCGVVLSETYERNHTFFTPRTIVRNLPARHVICSTPRHVEEIINGLAVALCGVALLL